LGGGDVHPQKSRRRVVWGMEIGYPPSRLGSLGQRHELPQQGPGRNPGRKQILCTLELTIIFSIFEVHVHDQYLAQTNIIKSANGNLNT